MFRTKIVHTSGKMFDFGGSTFWGRKISLTYVTIQSLIHRIRIRYQKLQFPLQKHQKSPNTFEQNENVWKISKIENFQKLKFLFCIMYTFHNSYFYNFYIFVKFLKIKNVQKLKLLFCIMYTFHNSYFSYFYFFLYFYIINYFL